MFFLPICEAEVLRTQIADLLPFNVREALL